MTDLDKFKAINDSLGHPVGDQLLIQVGRRLDSCIRTVDRVARLGGDEFAVILEEFAFKQELTKVPKRMHPAICEPFTVFNDHIITSGNIGIVPNMVRYTSSEDILRDADIAMYRAKQQEKGYRFLISACRSII
jgi:diguanylate cyclase (GGDEF)-like protein